MALAAPDEVSGTGASGSAGYPVQAGLTGTVDLSVSGLVAGKVTNDTVAIGALLVPPTTTGNAANKVYAVTVPAGTTLARFDEVAGDAGDDLDVFVFDSALKLAGQSATESASERVDLTNPAAGTYYVVVNGFKSTDGQPAGFSLRTFAVPGTPAGNLTAAPDPLPVTVAATSTVTLSWSGLTAGTPYLGTVGYAGSDQKTIVSIG